MTSKWKRLVPALLLLLAVVSNLLSQELKKSGGIAFWCAGIILFAGAATMAVRQTKAEREATDSSS